MIFDNHPLGRLAGRFGITAFDLTVYLMIAGLLGLIGLTAFISEEQDTEWVIYLKMDERYLYELWISTPDGQDQRQLTATQNGIWEFDVSSDGRYIVYTQRNFSTGGHDLYILDLTTGESAKITDCESQDADCYAPKFQPNGNLIAYERASLNSNSPIGPGAPRIWILNLDASETTPLIDERTTSVLGTGATWSGDGKFIAFYDNSGGNILIYKLADSSLRIIQTQMGITGALSPDGLYLVYPELSINRGVLRLFNTDTNLIREISNPADQADEQFAVWSKDGRYIAIGRRPADMRGTQVYLLDMETFNHSPLLIDNKFNHGSFSWNQDGSMMVMTRFRQLLDNGQPNSQGTLETWTYDLTTHQLYRLSDEGTFTLSPKWITPPRRFVSQ
jgi:Tol biopolymer transport system component